MCACMRVLCKYVCVGNLSMYVGMQCVYVCYCDDARGYGMLWVLSWVCHVMYECQVMLCFACMRVRTYVCVYLCMLRM